MIWRAAILLCLLAGPVAGAPTFEQVKAEWRSSERQLLDRHGALLQSLRIDLQARRLAWVDLADMSPAMTRALLQAEDQHFMEHKGVDYGAIGKAAWENLFRSRARGASTITMQLAAQLDPALRAGTAGRSWGQKWDQMKAAKALEASWSKAQILEAYLNVVSYRGELQGIHAAARTLFDKHPSGLDQAEAAILVSLLRAPAAAPKLVAKRACLLAKEVQAAASCVSIEMRTLVALARHTGPQVATAAPQVAQKLLKLEQARSRSSLDGPLQNFAQQSLRQQLQALGGRNVGNGAVLVLDNASGEILAYVGNSADSAFDAVLAPRQAGSTLKPFLYQLALERRQFTAASLLDDAPLDIATEGGLYIPQNYDRAFKGHVSVRTSLASSLNVPAVRTLVATGLERFHQRLQALGLSTVNQPAAHYGYALALGAAEVNLLELSNAYRTLANGGMYGPLSLQPGPRLPLQRRMEAGASFVVADILADRAARSLTFGLRNELATGFWAAVKTGTSKDMRDNWCIGFSDKYTVGVWVGNADGTPMWDVSGMSGAAPVWRDVMDYLHQGRPGRAPPPPKGLVFSEVAFSPATEPARKEWFIAGTEMPLVELKSAQSRAPMILYPTEGTLIAIDPDIPANAQQVRFRAQGGQALQWFLDGVNLGSAAQEASWRPEPGKHQLGLVDPQRGVVMHISFQVRGAW